MDSENENAKMLAKEKAENEKRMKMILRRKSSRSLLGNDKDTPTRNSSK